MRVPPVGPEQQQAVEFGLYVGKLRLSFWEDSKKATVFLEGQNKKGTKSYVHNQGTAGLRRDCRKGWRQQQGKDRL